MKKCSYCGRENADEALHCKECGTEFEREVDSESEDLHDEVKTVTIRIFGSRDDAQLTMANLEAHGIECWIISDDGGGMYPNLALVGGGLRLKVRASDAEAAVALVNSEASPSEISELETEAVAAPPPSETVPPRKLAIFQIIGGIIVGVLLTLLYQWTKIEGAKTYYHHAANGQVDEMWIYQDGHLAEYRQDRNLDGEWDHRTYYKNGKAVRAEYDDNFDGKPDAWWAYSDDGTDTLQEDTDFNGTPDEFYTYKKRIMQGLEIKPNGSKFAITKEIFSNGILTEIWRGGDSNGNFQTVEKYDPFFNLISTNKF